MSSYEGGAINNGVDWGYYDRFKGIDEKYLPDCGEGDNMATQIVTATSKLVYKWYNDGDVYDNQYSMEGWCNDLSSYANWLFYYAKGTDVILNRIKECISDAGYEYILKDLIDLTNTEEYLKEYEKQKKVGSIYDCDGPYRFVEEDEDDWEEEEDEDYE